MNRQRGLFQVISGVISVLVAASAGAADSCRSTGCSTHPASAHTSDLAGAAFETLHCTDPSATRETNRLYQNLMARAGNPLFGLQVEGLSDVGRVTGNPASVSGYDALGLIRTEPAAKPGARPRFVADKGLMDKQRHQIQESYQRGELITMSWHMRDPVSGEPFDAYPKALNRGQTQKLPRIREVLKPGSPAREAFEEQLDLLADYMLSLKDKKGRPIPVVFRPLHEHNGSWFWWGADHCTPEEYRDLYRLMVDHLRKKRKVNQLLIAWSPADMGQNESRPNQQGMTATYYRGYPGDSYVDVFGIDAYHSLDKREDLELTGKRFDWIARQARKHGKVLALTEVGALGEKVDRRTWYTDHLGRVLSEGAGRSVSYIMAWRNNGASGDKREDCFPENKDTEWNRGRLADFERFRKLYNVDLLKDLRAGELYRSPQESSRKNCSR